MKLLAEHSLRMAVQQIGIWILQMCEIEHSWQQLETNTIRGLLGFSGQTIKELTQKCLIACCLFVLDKVQVEN